MAKIKGWLAKYGQIGFNDTEFIRGCFKENNGRTVPVVDKLTWLFTPSKVIGTADLFLRKEGLYCVADVDLSKMNFEPRSFEFLGNDIERGDNSNQIKSVKVQSVSLLDVAPTKISYVEEIEK